MPTKQNPGVFDCYKAAMVDEPIFTILGRDPAGPATLRFWASERARIGKVLTDEDIARHSAALTEAREMEDWREQYLDWDGSGTPLWKADRATNEGNPVCVSADPPDHGELAGTCDCSAGYSGASDHARSCPSYTPPVAETVPIPAEPVVVDSEPDNLAHAPEIPPHRFSVFHKGETYAYARGLEINPSHLPAALDRMAKDGWHLQAIFGQTDSEHIGFIFRRFHTGGVVVRPSTIPAPQPSGEMVVPRDHKTWLQNAPERPVGPPLATELDGHLEVHMQAHSPSWGRRAIGHLRTALERVDWGGKVRVTALIDGQDTVEFDLSCQQGCQEWDRGEGQRP